MDNQFLQFASVTSDTENSNEIDVNIGMIWIKNNLSLNTFIVIR